jgi:acetolactate synthase I/II/III large subunit
MEQNVPVNEGAEAFVELLNANGVEYIFLNPGTGSSAIQEALVKFKVQGKRTPSVILCLHEYVGMAAAHGHFMISGKPQVVLVHEAMGTQQAGGALYNADRCRIGVVFCATRVPRSKRLASLHWLEERFDQASVVREYVKWYYELRTNENMHEVVQRAFQVASTEPCGPVYLSLPADLLTEKMDNLLIPEVARYNTVVTPQADAASLARTASILNDAKNPLIITGYAGRNHKTVTLLIELAEILGARVITTQRHLNFPTTHPLYSGFSPEPFLKDADATLIIDMDIPYVPAIAKPPPGSRIIHIDIDPVKPRIPFWHFPVDEFIQADSGKAIPILIELIRQGLTMEQKSRIQTRFGKIQKEHQQLLDNWHKLAMAQTSIKPISPEWLCHCINEAIDQDTIVIEEAVTSRLSTLRQLQRTKPGTFFTSEAASLGWSLGAALGVKLARPESTVVSLIGDGGFNFGCPTAVLWAASTFQIPFLCVIFNNKQYHVSKSAIMRHYGPGSFSQTTGSWIGVDIKPSPDYAAISRACHCYGQTVESPSDVLPALKIALEQVHNGKTAVLDIIIENP